jgi:RNA polymerase-binding transcription factor DksA
VLANVFTFDLYQNIDCQNWPQSAKSHQSYLRFEMPKAMTTMLRAQMLEEIQQLRLQIVQYIQQEHQPEFGNLSLKLAQSPLSHWPELLQQWLTPELKNKAMRLEALLAAISLMDMGLYGLCCDCEQRIERELLLRDPARQRCQHCSAKIYA